MKMNNAFTMIELIIAIVIIGIVTLVLPSVIATSNKNAYQALKEEGINAMSVIMYGDRIYPFDNNSNNNILDITNCSTNAFCDNTSLRNHVVTGLTRIGIPTSSYHRRFNTAVTNPDALSNSPLIATNADLITTTASHAYKAKYKYTTTLDYVNDNNNILSTSAAKVTPSESNMKLMTYELKRENSSGVFETIATFRQYKLNIGTPELVLW